MIGNELILRNAHIYTMDEGIPEATSILIRDGHIIAVAANADELPPSSKQQVTVIDLNGRSVFPGLCDSHIHLEKYALMLDQVDCETDSLHECLQRVERMCQDTPPGSWVFGHGWNQNDWGAYGTLSQLDKVSPNNPVYLTAKSLHAGWANSKALEIAGLSNATADPSKGSLQRDGDGNLTGILFENAMQLISSQLPRPSLDSLMGMILRAQQKLLSWGITAVHDFDGLSCLGALSNLEKTGRLRLRVLKHIREKDFEAALAEDFTQRFNSDWLQIGHLKLFADGALGPRTAAMLQSYEGEPDNCGMLLFTSDELVELGSSASKAGYPMAIHAIGDQANRTALDAFEKLSTMGMDRLPAPHRIEHVQLLHPEDIPRLAQLDVTASMQPIHALSDHAMADQYWGARARWSYAWKSQYDSGARVIFGSDAPVESPDPWLGIFAATTRQPLVSQSNTPAWIPEERVSLEQAILGYTKNPAQTSAWKGRIGQLTAGYAADLIVLDQDPFELDQEGIANLRPAGVMSAGEWQIREF